MKTHVEKVFHNHGTAEWLKNSTLNEAQIAQLADKYESTGFDPLLVVNNLTPEEALYCRPVFAEAICNTLEETQTPKAILELTAHELLSLHYRTLAKEASSVSCLSHALISAARGNATERKHAKSMGTRKFSHHTYAAAATKARTNAKLYLESLKLEVPNTMLEMKELALFRAEFNELLHGDYLSTEFQFNRGIIYDVKELPLIKKVGQAIELQAQLSADFPELRFIIKQITLPNGVIGYVCRNSETYVIRDLLVVKTRQLDWKAFPMKNNKGNIDVKLKPLTFPSMEEVFFFSKNNCYADILRQQRDSEVGRVNEITVPQHQANKSTAKEIELLGEEINSLLNEDINDAKQRGGVVGRHIRTLSFEAEETAHKIMVDGDLSRLTERMMESFPVLTEALYRAFYNPPIEKKLRRRIVNFDSGYAVISDTKPYIA